MKALGIATAILFAATMVSAQSNPGSPANPHEHMGPPDHMAMGMLLPMHAFHTLNLTTDQQNSVHTLMKTYMEGDLGAALKAFHNAHHALQLAIWGGGDDSAIASANNGLAAAEQNLISVERKLSGDVLAVLTPAQREQLKTEMAKMPQHPDGPPPQQ